MPNAEHARIPELKVTAYLLNHDHPEGKSKADFLTRFGFDGSDWRELQTALHLHAGAARILAETENRYGIKYEIGGELKSPDRRHPEVVTVWIIEAGDSSPVFVTLNPSKRRSTRDDLRA